MVELQFLGSLAAMQGSLDLTASIAQPKRLALLAWLELSRPYGLHPRDTLSGLLWPESPNDKARAALRQLLLVLRRHLGYDVFVMEGELVGINRSRVMSDAGRTLDALEKGDDELAASLYSGDLLPGLPFAEGEYFERWFEQRRAELKRAVVLAAWRLVDRAESIEDLPTARRYAERAFSIDSEDEAGLRRVMTLQARGGDRSAALRSHELYARRLREDWSTEPDPATQGLLERIRTGALTGDVAPTVSRTQSLTETTRAEPNGVAAPPRRRVTLGLAGALLVVAGTAGWIRWWFDREPTVERLAVLPFENRTGNPAHDQLGLMATDWVSRGLVDARLAEVIPHSVVTQAISEARESKREVIRSLVDLAGATRVVTGAYYAVADSIRFQAEWVEADRLRSLAAIHPATAVAPGVMTAIDSLSHRVVGAAAEMLNAADGWGTGLTPPPSLEVYRLYLRTEAAFRTGRWDEMERLARQAFALDSTHVNSGIQLVNALYNLGRAAEADSMLRRLESLPRLRPGDALFLSLMRAFVDGDIETLQRIVASDSLRIGDGDARAQMAQNALNLNRPREALRTYQRVNWRLAEVAENPSRWQISPTAHHLLGDYAEELKQAKAIRKRFPGVYWLLELEAAALAAMGREQELEKLKAEARDFENTSGAIYGDYGNLLLTISADQLWHRSLSQATATASQAVAWFKSRPASEAERWRWRHASALLMAGRGTEARMLLPPACGPTDWECHTWQGVVAAAHGDTLSARRSLEVITMMGQSPRTERGSRALGSAAIAASLGEKDGAVEYLRRANSTGMPTWFFHWGYAAFFRTLRGHGGFEEFMRPKG
jgi:DNA-binding SARP family transcriptional activator/TolB-like protein